MLGKSAPAPPSSGIEPTVSVTFTNTTSSPIEYYGVWVVFVPAGLTAGVSPGSPSGINAQTGDFLKLLVSPVTIPPAGVVTVTVSLAMLPTLTGPAPTAYPPNGLQVQ